MNDLPKLVQRAPAFFYGAAILFFAGSLVLTHFQIENAFESAGGTMDSYRRLTLMGALLQAFEGSLYLVGNGVVAQILLAIWRKGRDSGGGGAA